MKFTPYETGLVRFVDLSKEFIGKAALVPQEAGGGKSSW
jgi:glycine cleavage system aminomethyltransferase T